jgi:hypothetical protein
MERYGHNAKRGRPGLKAKLGARFSRGAVVAAAFAVSVAFVAALAGCGGGASAARRPETAQLIDEAFAALFPEAWASLGALPEAAPQRLGPAPKGAADSPVAPVPLQSIGQAADRLIARLPREGLTEGGKPPVTAKAIIASPLSAETLVAAAGKAGAVLPPLVVPFAVSFGLSGGSVREVRYDYAAAYAAMGRRAAAAVKKLPMRDGARPACGIVFQENFMRGGGALEAFVSAFSAASGQSPIVATLDARSVLDSTGAARTAVAEVLGDAGPRQTKPALGVLVLAIDNAAIADEAARKAGGMTVFADASSWGERPPDTRLYRAAIKNDEAGLARAAIGLARRLASGRDEPAPTLVQLRFKIIFPKIF